MAWPVVEHRLDGLVGDPRPGPPQVIGIDQVEDIVVAVIVPVGGL